MMLPLQHPFTAIVAGPTGCGKSEWVLRLIGHAKEMIEPSPEEIWYCYGEFQPIFAHYPKVKFHEGMPDFTKFDGRRSTFLVLDDLMSETNDDVANLFTKGSHHRNVSAVVKLLSKRWWISTGARPEGPTAEVGFPTADQGLSSIQHTLFGFCGI